MSSKNAGKSKKNRKPRHSRQPNFGPGLEFDSQEAMVEHRHLSVLRACAEKPARSRSGRKKQKRYRDYRQRKFDRARNGVDKCRKRDDRG